MVDALKFYCEPNYEKLRKMMDDLYMYEKNELFDELDMKVSL